MLANFTVKTGEKLGSTPNAQNVKLLGIGFRLPLLGTGLKLLQVILEGYVILGVVDFSK